MMIRNLEELRNRSQERSEWLKQLLTLMREGVHYMAFQQKPILTKAGAEHLVALYAGRIVPRLERVEQGTYRVIVEIVMDGDPVGIGYGAASVEERNLARSASPHNTAIKMAYKRALVAAVINWLQLSELFEQDLDERNYIGGTETEPVEGDWVVLSGYRAEYDTTGEKRVILPQIPPEEYEKIVAYYNRTTRSGQPIEVAAQAPVSLLKQWLKNVRR